MKCPSCTKEIKEGLKFCPKCGVHIYSAGGPKSGNTIKEQPAEVKRRKLEAVKSARLWKIFFALSIAPFVVYFIMLGVKSYMVERSFRDCQLYRRSGRYELGIEACNKALKHKPTRSEAWVELTMCYKGLDDDQSVVSKAGEGLKMGGDDARLYALRAEVLYKEEKFEPARSDAAKALELDPDNNSANQYLGYILAMNGDTDNAITHLKKALDGAGRAEREDINYVLGDLFFKAQRYDAAIDHYIVVREMEMNDVDLCLNLSNAYFKNLQLDEATKEVNRCSGIAPDNDKVNDQKMKIILQIQRVETARYILSRKELDDLLQIQYSSLMSYIDVANADMDAFIGQPNPELENMIKETENLMEKYRKLRAPDVYYIMHSETLNTVSTLIDTMKYLRRFLSTGEQQHMTTLEHYIEASEKRMSNLMEIWVREYKDLDLKKMIDEAAELENATGTVTLPEPGLH